MASIINASTSSGLVESADTSGQLELQSNGNTQLTVSSTGAYGQLKSATAQASTSGTSIDFTNIPSWVKRITVMFNGVSTSGTSYVQVQIGSGSPTTTGYKSAAIVNNNANITGYSTYTTGFGLDSGVPAATTNRYGVMTIVNLSGNTWCYSYNGWLETYGYGGTASGTVTISGALDRVRITTVNGTDTFDAGSINIMYEG